MSSTFTVQKSVFVTGMNSILTQSAPFRSISGSVTTSSGNISLSSVTMNYRLVGNGLEINLNGYLNVTSDTTVSAVTFTITYSFYGGSSSASSTVSGLSSSLTTGLYLVSLTILVEPQPAEVYL